jgi:hypothetical protein
VSFLTGAPELRGTVYHHTGTFLRFPLGARASLPSASQDVELVMPDGVALTGRFNATAAFPYIAGAELVRWIKGWFAYGAGRDVVIANPGRGPIVVRFAEAPSVTLPSPERRLIRRRLMGLGGNRPRTRQTYERWERDPALRQAVLSVWGSTCQVLRCRAPARLAGSLAGRVVDVHHLRSVSRGGSDSGLNLVVLCVLHHALLHRAPKQTIRTSDAQRVEIEVNGVILQIRRDAFRLMRSLQP